MAVGVVAAVLVVVGLVLAALSVRIVREYERIVCSGSAVCSDARKMR
jgi:hypothetical protein